MAFLAMSSGLALQCQAWFLVSGVGPKFNQRAVGDPRSVVPVVREQTHLSWKVVFSSEGAAYMSYTCGCLHSTVSGSILPSTICWHGALQFLQCLPDWFQ